MLPENLMPETKTRFLPLEAAEYLQIGYDKLMQMCRLKKIPHYKIGNRYFFMRTSLDLWVENLERQSIQEENTAWNRR